MEGHFNYFQELTSQYDLLPTTFWTSLTIDYESNLSRTPIKSLMDLCSEKMISDVSMLFKVHRLPSILHSCILYKALSLNRVLSIDYLLRHYPETTFQYPIPEELRNWSVFFKKKKELGSLFTFYRRNIEAVMQAFFNLIQHGTATVANLQVLDMQEAAIGTGLLIRCLNNITLLKNPPKHLYVLKSGFIVNEDKDLEIISTAKTAHFISNYFKLEVTGLHIYNSINLVHRFEEVLGLLRYDELQHLSIELCLDRYNHVFPQLQKFQYLQTLSFTHIDGFKNNPNFLLTFAETLNSLPHLTSLSLRVVWITGCLNTIFRHKCNQDYRKTSRNFPHSFDCCLAHRGKLEYLDISCCYLGNKDLQSLWEFSVTKSLKFLNLGFNKFSLDRLSETLQIVGSSLIVIDIQSTVAKRAHLQHMSSILEFLPLVKSINMAGWLFSTSELELFTPVIKRNPNLRMIALSRPFTAPVDHIDFDFCDNFQIWMSENMVEISWFEVT